MPSASEHVDIALSWLIQIKGPVFSTVYVPQGFELFTVHAMQNTSGLIEELCPACSRLTKMDGMGFSYCTWEAWGGTVSNVATEV